MLVGNVAVKAVRIGEPLRSCTLPHAHNTVLLRMKDTALKIKANSLS